MAAFYSHADGPVMHAAYRRAALLLGHDHLETLHLQALVELRQGSARRSVETVRRALRREPLDPRLWLVLGWVLAEIGEAAESLAACRRAVTLDPNDAVLWPNLLWALDLSEHSTHEQRLAVREQFDELHCRPLGLAAGSHTNDPNPERRLRVGYLSADFFRHSAAFTFALPLRGHHHDAVEVFCYDSTEYTPDGMTGALRDAVDHWRCVSHLDDAALAAQIRQDRIDILVDLSGVTAGARLLALARRPAPIQITAWGYALGLGLSCIDYLLSDRVVIPPEHASRHREQILYLPHLMAADVEATGDATPEITPRPPDRPVTFGYFGRAMKLTAPMLALWAQIMTVVPDSRLILKMSDLRDALYRDRIVDMLLGLGIDGQRVEFRGETSRVEHLEQHNDIDIALDTSPVGGGTTTLDACLMGVPTVTLLGPTVPGRMSASILTAIGDEILIAESAAEYVEIASVLALRVAPGRGGIGPRRTRRAAFLSSIMCDADRYAGAVEDAYRTAWRSWCALQRLEASA